MANQFDSSTLAIFQKIMAKVSAEQEFPQLLMLLEDFYGHPLAPDLINLLQFCASSKGEGHIGEFFPAPIKDWLPDKNENSMEYMMNEAFRTYSLFSNSIFLGMTGSGDHWYFAVGSREDQTGVFLLDHESSELEGVCDSVAVFLHLQNAMTDEIPSQEDLQILEGNVRLGRELVIPRLKNPGSYQSSALNLDLSRKVYGIATHLHGQWPGHTPDELPSLTLGKKINSECRSFAEIIAYLWWLFLKAEDEQLRLSLPTFGSHPARIVRDTVLLLDEILAGRKKVGPHDDIYKLRLKKS